MESTGDLLKKFQKRDLTPSKAQAPEREAFTKHAQFVPIRRKGLAGDTADEERDVTQEALIDDEGVVGLGG